MTELLVDWDTLRYLDIVTRGYDVAIPVRPDGSLGYTNLAFFPLYPALVAIVDPALPGGPDIAAVVVSWSAGLAAAWGLYAIGRDVRDQRTGVMLAGLWAVVPHAVVESMGYAETSFTALAAWSLFAVLRRRWITAGLLCFFAGLARPTAMALAFAVALALLVPLCRGQDGWRPWIASLLAPAGLLGYVAWVGLRLGRIDGYLHVQRDAWHMSYDGGQYTVHILRRLLTHPAELGQYVTTFVLVVALALMVLLVVDTAPWPLVVYAGLVLAIVLGGAGYYHAKARLLLPAFPLLLPVAYALAGARRSVLVVVFIVLAITSTWYGIYLRLVWTHSP
ncbi:hypothetical protein [Krasilnikovia sp. MM14-A1004]|uniref:hypothetical protein n=1 Tax=Krasilnikovia sp. MM14-A1004 TaxID=3373541 RepID=UPI00399D05D2